MMPPRPSDNIHPYCNVNPETSFVNLLSDLHFPLLLQLRPFLPQSYSSSHSPIPRSATNCSSKPQKTGLVTDVLILRHLTKKLATALPAGNQHLTTPPLSPATPPHCTATSISSGHEFHPAPTHGITSHRPASLQQNQRHPDSPTHLVSYMPHGLRSMEVFRYSDSLERQNYVHTCLNYRKSLIHARKADLRGRTRRTRCGMRAVEEVLRA